MTKDYIRFDWAMKKLLRKKANFGILEGFLTTLLNERIIIKNLLESESNQESYDDKQNRVDLLAENSKGELIIIEVQGNRANDYFQRMLFATSKLVTEYIKKGENYDEIKKIYSVNIVYFSLGEGRDVVYQGKTEFRGIHHNDLLELSQYHQQLFDVDSVSSLYPEYYILKVNDFDSVAKTPLDEWILYLKTGELSEDASAPGLDEVRDNLKLESFTREEFNRYQKQVMDAVSDDKNLFWQIDEADFNGHKRGLAEGIEQGIKKGRQEGIEAGIEQGKQKSIINIAKNMKLNGLKSDIISQITGLSIEEIKKL
ncbi:MAG: Rpn family recombination-promoting nuclease/putative transposase [Rikenellaceae bacterium]